MTYRFNNDLLKKINNVLLLKKNNNIIIETNNSIYEKLNAKIVKTNKKNNIIHVRYYADSNDSTEQVEIINLDNYNLYEPYLNYPFYSSNKITKYGNKFVFEYYKTLNTINSIRYDYYNTIPSINYNKLPKILEDKINIKNPVRLHNKYDSILGCIIEGLPKIIKQTIDIESDNIEKYYRKYIIMHMNSKFIENIKNKYNISYQNVLHIKYQLEDKIIDNFLLSIICSEIFKINIKIYKYINNEDIDMYNINDKELVSIYIYNTGNIYELITSKKLIIER